MCNFFQTKNICWLVVVSSLLFSHCAWSKEDFVIQRIETSLVENIYILDGSIQYQFSKTALEALQNGVALTLEVVIEVLQQRDLLWDKKVYDISYKSSIHYNALSDLYQVISFKDSTKHNFSTLNAALRFMGALKKLQMFNRNVLTPDVVYMVRMKTLLDIEALPIPLRPLAYFSSSWQLYSEWFSWRLGR
jgi:uncharacterized protein YfkK (UPF0435 family)